MKLMHHVTTEMRNQRRWSLRLAFFVAVIISCALNGRLSADLMVGDTIEARVDSRIINGTSQDSQIDASGVSNRNSKHDNIMVAPRPASLLLIGISCPGELQSVILNTYLNRSLPNHSFRSEVLHKFYPKETPIRSWWSDVIDSSFLPADKKQGNPWVLWLTGPTLLYPPYWNTFLEEQERRFAQKELLVGETSPSSCSGIHKRSDRITCNRLGGQLVLTTFEALRTTTSCWNDNVSSFWKTVSSPPIIRQSTTSCWNSTETLEIPRLYRIHDSDIAKYEGFWRKLAAWNNLPVGVDFVTAKFGRLSKFKPQVIGARDSLLRFGVPAQKIHAYYDFPDFIMQDSRWSSHLRFLHDTSLPPKGAGFWFWKAPLILHHLHQGNWNDFVSFADADLADHHKWIPSLIDRMLELNTTLALYQVEYSDHNYTKRDVWTALCPSVDPLRDFSLQYAGGWMVVQKTKGTLRLLERWQEAKSDIALLGDSKSELPNLPGFDYHLHDQSMLSLLIKCQYSDAYKQRQIFERAVGLKDWSVHMFQI